MIHPLPLLRSNVTLWCVVSLGLILVSGCSPQPIEIDRRNLTAGASNDGEADSEKNCLSLDQVAPGYEPAVKDLMTKYCTNCHRSQALPPALPLLETYDQVKNAGSRSRSAIEAGRMPIPPQVMPPADQAVFAAWVDAQMPLTSGAAVAPEPNSPAQPAGPSKPKQPAATSKSDESKCAKPKDGSSLLVPVKSQVRPSH